MLPAMASLTSRVEAWRKTGERVTVGGHQIFVRRRDGASPLLVFLHGFPSSSYDWRFTLERLNGQARLAFDFLGFGLSDKPRRAHYSLFDQADLVQSLVSDDRSVVVVAHDMGTSVATELLARDLERSLNFEIAAVLLFNGSMIIERASLTWAQKGLRSPLGPVLARMSNRPMFVRQFGRLFSTAHPLSAAEGKDQWALWRYDGGARIAHRLTHYLDERRLHAPRWHGAIRDWPGPLHFAWGMQDPVATPRVLAGLRELRPSAPVTELPDLGHYPQLERPEALTPLIEYLARRS
jgi:pimeloyl-ACP methyl ester carboxylesterase